jgi:hypothetical protein
MKSKSSRQLIKCLSAALAAAAFAAPAAHAHHAPATVSAGSSFTVTSSLDGRRVLPLRSRWLVYPKARAATIKKVDFLIDGKLRWIEHYAPYNYGSDDFQSHLGYLITTFLTPGRHTFTARAVDKAGRKAVDTVTARVVPAPEPPAELAGVVWKRNNPNLGGLSGEWELIFDHVGSWHLDPLGGGVLDEYDIAGGVLHLYAPITFGLKTQSWTKLGHKVPGSGQGDCREDGPFGTYHWSVTRGALTLTAIKEGCPGRRHILEGTWTRAQ